MDGWMHRWLDTSVDGYMHACMPAWIDAWVGGKLTFSHGSTGLDHNGEAGEEYHACRTVGI